MVINVACKLTTQNVWRYNDFKWLRGLLLVCYPGLFIPPLPLPVFLGRFADSFVSKRRAELEHFLVRLEAMARLAASEMYRCFVDDDASFALCRAEICANPSATNPATATLALLKIFPQLADADADADDDDTVSTADAADFERLRESLQSMRNQMKVLDALGGKLGGLLGGIGKELPQYANALSTLRAHELKSGLFDGTALLGELRALVEPVRQILSRVF